MGIINLAVKLANNWKEQYYRLDRSLIKDFRVLKDTDIRNWNSDPTYTKIKRQMVKRITF